MTSTAQVLSLTGDVLLDALECRAADCAADVAARAADALLASTAASPPGELRVVAHGRVLPPSAPLPPKYARFVSLCVALALSPTL